MNRDEIGLLRLRIEAGILLARRRLLAEAREEDRELAVMSGGRAVRLRARGMNADGTTRRGQCDGALGAEVSAPDCPGSPDKPPSATDRPGEPQPVPHSPAGRQTGSGTQ